MERRRPDLHQELPFPLAIPAQFRRDGTNGAVLSDEGKVNS
jgi:hypothetical protein